MLPWNQRAIEEASLFNPAFCGALIVKSVEEYASKVDGGMPFPLSFLILPVVLHRATREVLPTSTITSLHAWLQDNRDPLVDFATRARRLRHIAQEAMMFSLLHGTLALSTHGALLAGERRVTVTDKTMSLFTREARECFERARFLGRWFAVAGTPATVMAAWGVSP
ncbi:MAG: three component ABC system middle component [Polyangiaceae bacterium]